MKRPFVVFTAVAATAVLLAGCGTGGATVTPQDTADINTDIAGEDVTITLAYASDPPASALVEGFQEKFPNVTVDMVQTPFADYQTSLKLAMASDDSPDLVQYSPGPMRSIVPAGLVEKLEPYAEAYGWRDKVAPGLLGMLTSNESATEYGSGNLYAMPGAIQMIGVFYNKQLTEAAGVTDTPETLVEFEEDLAAVQKSGVAKSVAAMPALGIGGFQLWGVLANVLGDVETFNDWVYGKEGTSLLSDEGFTEAAAVMAQWSEAGYFPTGAAAIDDATAIASFEAGENAYYVTGNWNTEVFESALGDDLGFFLMPGTTADAPAVATASGTPYAMSAKSQHKDVAAAFLDYISSVDAAPYQLKAGLLPVTPDAALELSPAVAAIQEGYLAVSADNGSAPFSNWASSSMIDTLTSGSQGVLNGAVTPQAFVESLQADWESNRP
ncbi:ABC transporter substrate-binding protein [Microbacterium sp. A93]|uniref:ABC transporter substrate-binding protein n=1 Tax=Microbacterium sp. A93 TaxID=3450716 RepID=UPI003F42E79C